MSFNGLESGQGSNPNSTSVGSLRVEKIFIHSQSSLATLVRLPLTRHDKLETLTKKLYYLTVLKSRNPRSRCWQGYAPSEVREDLF